MTLQLATFIITTLIVSNPFSWMFYPVQDAEVKIMATDSSLDHVYLEVPYLDIGSYYPGGPKGVDEYQSSIEGIEISEAIKILEGEYDICVETTPALNPTDFNQEDITYVRSGGVDDAPGLAKSTFYAPEDPYWHRPEFKYISLSKKSTDPKWSGFGQFTIGVNSFSIELKVVDC